jgi:hypothetical protein
MDASYYLWFIVFVVIVYFIATDESISTAFDYLIRLAKFEFEKRKWMILHDPRNPIVRWNMERRAYKLAKELQDEMERRSKTTNDDSTTFK